MCLLHDIGKTVSTLNHAGVSAEILKPYVSDDLFQLTMNHQTFEGFHYYQHYGLDPNGRDAFRDEPWYDLAVTFADEWDSVSFDPDYDTLPLEHFEPALRRVLSRTHANADLRVYAGATVVTNA
jgi:predicted HD phosphohydrolase